MDDMHDCQQEVAEALISMNRMQLRQAYQHSGLTFIRFAEDVLVPVMDRFGEQWNRGDLSLSQIYMSGCLCEALLSEFATAEDRCSGGQMPMAVAVLEDFHVLGKRIVSSVLRAGGYAFTDYGPITVDDLVAKVSADGIKILLVSTLMLSSALRVSTLRQRLNELPWQIRLIVGGAPFRFDPELWRQVGADATSPTASGVLGVIRQFNEEAQYV